MDVLPRSTFKSYDDPVQSRPAQTCRGCREPPQVDLLIFVANTQPRVENSGLLLFYKVKKQGMPHLQHARRIEYCICSYGICIPQKSSATQCRFCKRIQFSKTYLYFITYGILRNRKLSTPCAKENVNLLVYWYQKFLKRSSI